MVQLQSNATIQIVPEALLHLLLPKDIIIQLPKNNGKVDKHKNIGEKNGKRKNGKKKSSRSSGDSFKVHGNTINGGKGDKVGVFDFGNKYSRGGKKRDEEEEDSTEEETDSGTEDERD
ncbi:PREDICTED: uncharacterized protein LOC103323138 isoform X3 [Prunus mume]|uniref:Uncharacterized protein LOC103323138 isoform X3 n=1 Tax=Prunus mume TaxID=102107 RepID=A0ABM0NDV0_PRUMU|nr:PREDICTED: uncharacterized protein LOC103323138 isoform X3 [Prunus mume]